MHFQSATPCVRHDHALSARGRDFFASNLSLTGLVNAYWPDWHTSSRKLTKWCLTDNLAQFRELSPLTSEEIIFIFKWRAAFIHKIKIIPFSSFTAFSCFVSCFTLWTCSWQGATDREPFQEPGFDLRRCTSLSSWPSQKSLAWHPLLGIVISKVILESFFSSIPSFYYLSAPGI